MRKKAIRTRGKLQLSRYFQKLAKGDSVAIVREEAVQSSFPKRIQGKTGIIEEQRGRVYVIRIKENNKEKKFLIEPIHLKKINL
jgi:ribosomal protein L21E